MTDVSEAKRNFKIQNLHSAKNSCLWWFQVSTGFLSSSSFGGPGAMTFVRDKIMPKQDLTLCSVAEGFSTAVEHKHGH